MRASQHRDLGCHGVPAFPPCDQVRRQGGELRRRRRAAISLVLVGTITYSLGEGWNVADGFYFAVCTLTTSSIADPHLTLTHEALKIFTALYVLTGIGILVEVARQLGVGFVKLRAEQSATRHARRHKDDPPETQSTE